MLYLKNNLDDIQGKILSACKKSGRNPEEIKLIAVTKTIDTEIINESILKGVTAIGENKVQEITRKFDHIETSVEWHLIGHLQSNKVKYIIDKVDLIHSVDSVKLATEINKRAKGINKKMEILVQVNVADEDSKFGIESKDVKGFVEQLSNLENIEVKGLMTIAPFDVEPENVRMYFRELKTLFDKLSQESLPNVNMKYLSMGMTNDFEIAIEEGANILRIGTGIYGKRDYTL